MTAKDMKNKGHIAIFMSYYKPHMAIFLLDMACALGVCLVDLSFPMASRYALNELLPQGLFDAFFALMGILLLAYLFKAAFSYVIGYWGHLLGARIETDIRRDLFHHMETLSFSFFDKNRTGQLMSRVTGDLFEITELAHHGPEDLFISTVTLIGAFCVMLTVRWELALIVFAVVPVFFAFTVVQRRRMSRASAEVKKKLAVINGEVESSISGIRTAQAFANEAEEKRKFNESNHQFRDAKRGYYQAMATYHAGMELCMGILPVLVIAAGGLFIIRGTLDYVDLVTFSLYVTTFITPIRKLSAFVEQFMQGMAGFGRFVELMRTQPEITESPDAADPGQVKGDIDIDHVTFAYDPGKPNVLEDIDLHIPAGETVAVVGPSGGGKSTLCQLIPRFYDVTAGCIRVDGRDVRELTLGGLRKNIGVVQQDVFLFAGTIFDNIAYGKPGATAEEVYAAAKRAELYDDVMAMPDGFQTYVGERGVMLSGGQKQRVSIARVFLKDPPVLILDEATSALDTVTEQRIQGAFDELAKGRTTLIIAHRLSTVKNASRIAVIDDNRVVELGTWEELVEKGGEFARLCRAQEIS